MLETYNDVLTPVELKSILHLGTNKIYQLLSDGIIKSIRCGKKILIPKIFVEDFLSRPQNIVDSDKTDSETCQSATMVITCDAGDCNTHERGVANE